ncbi:MAG: cryptochrome/photolyase family protein [Halioglobus sp.]|nr:cryptochrome/photolyase family protein [Halioglobus sp.]
MARRLLLVLGDQLTLDKGALSGSDPASDVVVMAEVHEEATYVRHNRHKIVFIFAAIRHFRDELRALGFRVIYFEYGDGVSSIEEAVLKALDDCEVEEVRCCKPGEYRLLAAIESWHLPVPCELIEDDRFLVTHAEFAAWANGRKSLRMEYFYREVRREYALLLDEDNKPVGGRCNFDAENRAGWRGKADVPVRAEHKQDEITLGVLELVEREFSGFPGDLGMFNLATTRAGALEELTFFLDHCLEGFGRFQDALADESPFLFHALISMYINIGLLDPLEVCTRAEERFRAGQCDIAAAEGFIRQVAGWREYVRGIYWLQMPDYRELNALSADVPLPEWFWTGNTEMRCLSQALRQSLDLGYAHHIQRLMVIGNFCLLAGINVKEVCDWYLAVYVDAFEWVELPNTLGMALHADEGVMASKPYAASGKYIQRQGNHCKQCRYSPTRVTGEGACPYNSLYWRFVHRHADRWEKNPRMGLVVRNWQRKSRDEQTEILKWAGAEMEVHCGTSS